MNNAEIRDEIQPAEHLSHSRLDWMDSKEKWVSDNKFVVGYITDDPDPINPLEDCDGGGRIFEARRHSSTLSEFFEALGRDSNGKPNLEAAEDYSERFQRLWVRRAADDAEFQKWCLEKGRPPANAEKLPAYLKRKASRFWRQAGGLNGLWFITDIFDFHVTDKVREELWEQLMDEGEIGDRDAVMLDVYEHSGVGYSVSGEGMQCRWDVARGGAVWVPDSSAREEIDRRAEVYRYGRVQQVLSRGRPSWTFVLDGDTEGMRFSYWHEAFEALQEVSKGMPKSVGESVARQRAARELARGAAEIYTDYRNGCVFGVVVETMSVTEDGQVKSEEEESVYGFFGFACAEQELNEMFDAAVADAERQQPVAD